MTMSYPSEWEDDQTMDVLFSPFRENRELNPHSWDRKMKFWMQTISQRGTQQKCALIESKTLSQSFRRKNKSPACLDRVIEEMLRTGKMQKLSDFTADTGWLSWSVKTFLKKPLQWSYDFLVKKPISWTWSRVVGENEGRRAGIKEELVLLDVVKQMAAEILERHCSTVQHELTDNIVRYTDLQRRCGVIVSDERNFDLSLLQLCRDQRCSVVVGDQNEKLVVFARGKTVAPVELTENDMRIFRLKLAENTLNQQITDLEQIKSSLRHEAKVYLNQGDKNQARGCLVKKKKVDRDQGKKEQSLDQIQQLLSLIQQAETHKQIIDAYRSGTEMFDDLRQKYGLTTEAIDKVMDGVQEVFDTQADLDESLSHMPSVNSTIEPSMEELEDELEGILAEDNTSPWRPGKTKRASGESTPHQELINSMCTMTMADTDALPEAPSHDPLYPPKLPNATSSPISPHTSPPSAYSPGPPSRDLLLPDVPSGSPTGQHKRPAISLNDERAVLYS